MATSKISELARGEISEATVLVGIESVADPITQVYPIGEKLEEIDEEIEQAANGEIDGSRIVDRSISTDKVTFITGGTNLYNSETATTLSYLDVNGVQRSASTLCVSDYIAVIPNTTYYWLGQQTAYGYAFYDANKTKLTAGAKGTTNNYKDVGSATSPANAAYLRVTFRIADQAINQVNQDSWKAYEAYSLPKIDEDLLPETEQADALQLTSLLGQTRATATSATITAGDELVLSAFPKYISKNLCITYSAEWDGFDTLKVGQRYGYILVDLSNIYVYGYNTDGDFVVRETIAHGLDLLDFIRVTVHVIGKEQSSVTMNAFVSITTANGMFSQEIQSWYYTHGGEVFAEQNLSGTNASLSATCGDFRCSVWAMGDSYFGMSNVRWPYYMRKLGYFNYFFEGLGGGTSYDMYNELVVALNYGTPKYLLWCLGMNNADTVDSDSGTVTINTSYNNYLELVKTVCADKGITLILATIPNTPTRTHTAKNEVVRNSGYRYIDFAKAVNAESAGASWYSGMLNADNVHPTALGAQSLASQVLMDFPELMQYGNIHLPVGGGDAE